MNKETFEEILSMLGDRLEHGQNHLRPISPLERLAITMRCLAAESSQVSLALNFRVSPSGVNLIIRETLEAICEALSSCLEVPDESGWELISKRFEAKWNFPMCCGAIDGKHIRIKSPSRTGSQYFNYKGFYSIVLLAVVDADHNLILVDVGTSGSCSDGGVFKNSKFGEKFERGQYELPPSKVLNGAVFNSVILGDDGFPLKPYLMKPYSGRYVQDDEGIFNYRLSRARMVVENAFGLLAARWRIFLTTIEATPQLATLIVKATILLHDFLNCRNDTNGLTADACTTGELIEGNWRDIAGSTLEAMSLSRQRGNNACVEAFRMRYNFKEYF